MNKGFLNFPHIYQKMNIRCHFTEKRSYTENHRGNFHSTYLPLITSQGWCIWIEGTLVRSKGLEEMAIPHSLLQLALPPSTACILFPNQINKAFPIKIPLTLDNWTINTVIPSLKTNICCLTRPNTTSSQSQRKTPRMETPTMEEDTRTFQRPGDFKETQLHKDSALSTATPPHCPGRLRS